MDQPQEQLEIPINQFNKISNESTLKSFTYYYVFSSILNFLVWTAIILIINDNFSKKERINIAFIII